MKSAKITALILALFLMLPLVPAVCAEDVVFTKQPQGGTVDNYTQFVITWETNVECEVLLQTRENETYDWGNMDFITSPYTHVDMADYSAQYRLWATYNDKDYYSDVFTITWCPSEKITTAEMEDYNFGEAVVGYLAYDAVPVVIKNTGIYDLLEPRLEFGYGDEHFELIQNREPSTIKAGTVDKETWSVRPKTGLGVDYCRDSLYLFSPSLSEPISSVFTLDVTAGGAELTYSMEANSIDFGRLPVGYGEQDTIDLVVRSTGTGSLSNVHIFVGDADTSFFTLYQNSTVISSLTGGSDSMTNWYVRLESGLSEGRYSTEIRVYADELEEPVTVTVRAAVGDVEPWDDPADAVDPVVSDASGKGRNGLSPWIIVVICACVAALAVAVTVIVMKKKK